MRDGGGDRCGDGDPKRRRGRRRPFALAGLLACALALGAPAAAQGPAEASDPEPVDAAPLKADPISEELAEKGFAAVVDRLSALAEPTPEDRFVLAGALFLRGVERAAQARHRYDLAGARFLDGFERVLRLRYDLGQAEAPPMLRLPLPRNAEPEPFEPAKLANLFEGVIEDMAAVEAAMAKIPAEALQDDAFGVTFSLDDIWIDSNGNGARDEAGPVTETLMDLSLTVLDVNPRGMQGTLVRFDAADVAWMRAYAHLLSAVSEMVLALDPATALEAARPGWEAAEAYRAQASLGLGEDDWIDQAAAALLLLRSTPDAERTQAALRHLEAMIAHSRVFWTRVAAEEDDAGEWIPNPRQKSALGGLEVSQEVTDGWAAVLSELELVLKGELLIPHWRFAENAEGARVGVNLRRVLENPGSADLALWAQGSAAAPYLEPGEIADGAAWRAFQGLVAGQSLAYALWFN